MLRKIKIKISVSLILVLAVLPFSLSGLDPSFTGKMSQELYSHQYNSTTTALLSDWSGYVPEAERFNLYILPITNSSGEMKVRFKEARLEGLGISLPTLEENRWVKTTSLYGKVSDWELTEFLTLRDRALQRFLKGTVEKEEEERYQRYILRIKDVVEKVYQEGKAYEPILVSLVPPKGLSFGDYLLTLTFERESSSVSKDKGVFSISTTLSILSLPNRPGWFRGDFHLHSIYSDGTYNLVQIRDNILSGRGYNIAYMTDHAGKDQSKYLHRSTCLCGNWISPPCNVNNTWSCYNTNCQRVSTTSLSFFPGAEISTSLDEHALAYGLNSLTMYDLQHPAQTVINNINANAPSNPSSAGIAHPVLTGGNPYYWRTWTVTQYRGFELVSEDSGHIAIDSLTHPRWRSEVTRLLPHTFNNQGFPSVRTGSDFHFHPIPGYKQYYTYLLLPTDWANLTWSSRKSWVDFSLHRGRTVASYHGSLGAFALNGQAVGSVLKGVSPGSTLNLHIVLHPARTGSYNIYIFRGDLLEQVKTYNESLDAGSERVWTDTINFPGGNQFYWLYISGPDYVTTSPIFVTSDP